jgi:hypothetical protein
MKKPVHNSETSVYSDETTRRYIPEGSKLHTYRGENLKYHTDLWFLFFGIRLKMWENAYNMLIAS